ncbi:NAD(P)(+)--arginine ADP-ribosyltransferase 2-like [Salminus brasiliensis]|uniref:NAD(P)(+)--arginine ADP-ribosyltransferase 2-like n=1 Tax=Salminus brasiliensis TaxID=930266 RepID=UPI003B837B37
MEMSVSALSVLLLLTASLTGRKSSGQIFPLDMAYNSVDDRFDGCKKDMYQLVATKYTEHEKQHTPGFSTAWTNALQSCTKGGLNVNQSAAIYLYTQDYSFNPQCSYKQFNKACQEGKAAYLKGDFQFYTLYYFLTEAVQALKQRKCVTVYRRTKSTYNLVVPKQRIRFGSFASSSLTKNLFNYGKVSCFRIKTCFGAKLGKYSALQHEEEVLIPPYEVFLITDINKKDLARDMKCKVVYDLKSDGTKSALNCKKIAVRSEDQQWSHLF